MVVRVKALCFFFFFPFLPCHKFVLCTYDCIECICNMIENAHRVGGAKLKREEREA